MAVSRESIRCACVIGTRPEAIKLMPIVRELAQVPWADAITISTGQQGDLLDQILFELEITPNIKISHVQSGLDLSQSLSRLVASLDATFVQTCPDVVIGQGDTTSAVAAAMAAFYRKIPFVHVEAGLRSPDIQSPFPEECHRRLIGVVAAMNCAPTVGSAQNLRDENIGDDRIVVTGNTVIDSLLMTARKYPAPPLAFPKSGKTILLTAHRRENFGAPMKEALLAVRSFLDAHPDVSVFFPVHSNPAASELAAKTLGGHERAILVAPVAYHELVGAMQASWLVVTDSGGLQEEAPALGKPVLVLRDETERPEAVAAGAARVVGTRHDQVVASLTELYDCNDIYKKMAQRVFPYGRGDSAEKIIRLLPGVAQRSRRAI